MLKLYTVATANGQRASIALEECGLAYDSRMIDLLAGEHAGEEMLALNAFRRMPVLTIGGGRHIYGSMAIGLYAAEASGRLLPPDELRPEFHHWLGVLMTDLAPSWAAQFYLGTLAPEPDEWAVNWYTDVITRFSEGINTHLAERKYFLGDQFTLADVLMYPTAATSMARMQGGLVPYPAISAWKARISDRPAVQKGMAASSIA